MTCVLWVATPAELFYEYGLSKYSPTYWAGFAFFCFVVALALGAFVGEKLGRVQFFSETRLLLSIRMPLTFLVVIVLCILALVGYGVWGYHAIRLGMDFSIFNMIITAQMSATAVKSEFLVPAMVHGVTILTQVLPAVLITLCLYAFTFRRYAWSILALALAFLTLVLLRTLFNGERICLMEAVIPAALLYAKLERIKTNISWILVILLAFIGFFVYIESTRSFIDKGLDEGMVLFGLGRLLIYFIAPVNYSLYLFDNLTGYYERPINILQWFYTGFFAEFLDNNANLPFFSVFDSAFGSIEFNNLGSLGAIYSDLGIMGILFAFLYALVTGYLYGQFKGQRLLGLMLYPLFVVSSLDFYQLFYFGTSRGFVPLLAIVLCVACYVPNRTVMRGSDFAGSDARCR